MPTYIGEYAGARVIEIGYGLTQVGDSYELDVTTEDGYPMGLVGECEFRGVFVIVRYTNGFSIGVTPIVDGVSEIEQTFNGTGAGTYLAQAFFATRGKRLGARIRTVARTGELEILDVQGYHVPLRTAP